MARLAQAGWSTATSFSGGSPPFPLTDRALVGVGPFYFFSLAEAFMNSTNNGWGSNGRDFNSGWN